MPADLDATRGRLAAAQSACGEDSWTQYNGAVWAGDDEYRAISLLRPDRDFRSWGKQLTAEEWAAVVGLAANAPTDIAALIAEVETLRAAITEFLTAEEEVEKEARRAEQPGANAWSAAPVARRIHAVKDLRSALAGAEP